MVDRYKFGPEQIYNLDETGNSTVHKPSKILAPKNIRQLGSLTSGERGLNVTMIACINAIGNTIPPMLIFPRVNFKDHMLNGGPIGCIGGANPSGWSNEGLFTKYFDHFLIHTKPSLSNPILLIMDNHESHINIDVIQKARDNGVILLTLHPHTSHKMQPLDRGVFGPYKSFYNKAAEEFMLTQPGKPITIYDISKIVGKAYTKAFTPQNIISGFKSSGIWPLDSNIFNENDFLQSYVTDRPENIIVEQLISSIPSTSSHVIEPQQDPSTSHNMSITSLEDNFPFPKADKRKHTTVRKRGKSRILTDTPEKNEVLFKSIKKTIKKEKLTSNKNIKILSDDIVVNCFQCKRLLKKHDGLKCDECKNYFHEKCIPKTHKENIPEYEDQDEFMCHMCFSISHESDTSMIGSEELFELCNKN